MGVSKQSRSECIGWIRQVERMDEYRMARRVLMAEEIVGRLLGRPEVRLDEWREGGLRQQRNGGDGCATMRER